MARILTLLFLAFSLVGSNQAVFAAKAFPSAPTQYIYDETNALSPSVKSELFQILSQEDHQNGNQVVVAVFKSLDGEELVDYTNRLFKAWNPGKKGHDTGVLLAAYLDEHKLRIEVGYGLEPTLTDAKSRAILESFVTPAFRKQDYSGGIKDGVLGILNVLHPESAAAPAQDVASSNNDSQRQHVPWGLVFFILIIFMSKIFGRRRGFMGGIFLGGGGGGWSSGGGGGGFGGFSGGGGSSGGGGASGGW
jgi:uncharacterized protein